MADWSTGALWLAVFGIGLYHGVNPGMGWPLAVSAAFMGGGRRGLVSALGSLAIGHFISMAGILVPFAAMLALVEWRREIRIGAGAFVLCAGLFLLVFRRHPKFLVRIRPTQLALWSFAVATAHGAGLMLLPLYLGLCGPDDDGIGHRAATMLMSANLQTALAVAAVHTTAMLAGGATIAFAVHEWLGQKFISASWFNLDKVWALSLALVGAVGLAEAMFAR